MDMGEKIKQLRTEKHLTLEQLGDMVGVGKSTVRKWENGMIANMRRDKIAKIADALGVSPAYLMGWNEKTRSTPTNNPRLIPVYGSVPAGIPIEAIEDIIDYEEITEEMARCGEYFGLIIKGDSMIPDLKEKDVVIVRKQEDAESGDIVIALVNGNDACCKRLMKYAGGVQLLSNNPAYEPMMFTYDEDNTEPIRIIGKVVESRRKY